MRENNLFKDEHQIEVKAGQTLVLEIIARPKRPLYDVSSSVKPANIRIKLHEFKFRRPAKIKKLKLFNPKNSYIIPIKDGVGELVGIEPGTYSLSSEIEDNNKND